ncbi:ABC transporter substrate-binding protein [Deinococcus antarcticus]|uniref:ABC transporter substrate-binding protein n=1 Tax=Deinococcus antarcticus TaxID=1298767 RepID=A0ABV8AD28_9DEIO
MKASSVVRLVSAVLALSASTTVLASHTGKRIVLAITQDEGELSPFTYVTGYPGYNMMSLVYDTLFLNDIGDVPRSWLVDSYSVKDGKVWTLKLKDGVKWHDGKPLTSADVKFSFEYYKKYPVVGRFSSAVKPITSIRTPDARTVIITLEQPGATFLLQPLSDAPIIPKHIWENVTSPKTFKNAVGSGPYKLVEHKTDQSYRLVENAGYFAGQPGADEVVLAVIPDPTSTFQALQARQINAAAREVPPELIQRFTGNDRMKTVRGPSYTSTLLQFNTTAAPLNNAGFRRVIAGLIDPKALVETILLGNGTPGSAGFVHPASPFYSEATPKYPKLTVAQAGKALDNLGYKLNGAGVRVGKDGKAVDLTMLVASNNPQRIRAAEIIAAQLRPVGLRLTIKSLDPTTVQQALWPDFDVGKGRNFDMAIWGWSAPVQSQLNLAGLFHSNSSIGTLNVGGYRNKTIDTLTTRLLTTVDAKAREGLAARVQEIVAKDLPFVTLWYPDTVYAFDPGAYDGWKFQKGQGIINKRSFLK